jgi:hypothetical protein
MTPSAAKPPVRDDSEWVRRIAAANEAYHDGRLHEALALYRDAFDEAERLFRVAERVLTSAPAATIFVITCQNLADAARQAGDPAAARFWLKLAFDRLASAAESPLTALALRIQAMRDLKFAFLNLVEPMHDDAALAAEIEAYASRGRRVVATVTQLVERIATLPPERLSLLARSEGRPS